MICGAGLFRPRKIMMIPAPTTAAPAPISGTFGSFEAAVIYQSFWQGGSSGFVGDAPTIIITPPTTVRTMPPSHTPCRDFLEPKRLASQTRRAEHRPMAQHGQSQATGRTGHRPADTEAWISFGGSLENGSRGFHRVSSIALVASDQPACIMTTRQCSHMSSTSSRERQTCERERSPFTSSTTSQPSWWVWREQTAWSSRSPFGLDSCRSQW